ncbi:hypothetical protein [Noviherbaspirillum sp. ST 5-3]|uniref:hypothetical protein n=2 Tax=Oxalobacteraceae TaxID=75682 RepID=UPI0039170CC5
MGRHINTSDSFPVGTIINAVNSISDAKWLRCDGSDKNRADYPDLSALFPANVFTATARTLAATPNNKQAIAADSTYFVAGAASGTTAMQYSTDGATWSQTSLVTPASTVVNSLIYAGSRFIAGVSGSAQPLVAANPASTWTVTTGGTTTTLSQGLAYASSLAQTLLIPDAAGTSVYTLADGATAWTAQTVPSTTKYGGCWTGQKYIVLSSLGLLASSDGVTWALTYPTSIQQSSFATSSIASDGNGTVVIFYSSGASAKGSAILVSSDHGATWTQILTPAEFLALSGVLAVTYINGKFFITCQNEFILVSDSTGLKWSAEPLGMRGIAKLPVRSIAYKAGVYLALQNGGNTSALSATENTAKFRLPASQLREYASSSPVMSLSGQEYIKAKK